jgi:hypothetical protein
MTQKSTTRESTRDRLAAYASLARIAPAVPLAIPSMMLVAEADATVYSQTGLSLRIGAGGANATLTITGAGGAPVGQISLQSSGSYVAIYGLNITWQALNQRTQPDPNAPSFNWFGGIPVNAGAKWNSLGRTTGQFAGSNCSFLPAPRGDINFGSSNAGAFYDDPQGVGNNGDTWYLLFQFTGGSGSGGYGWLSFTANVVGTTIRSGGSNTASYITITGWGWDDSGATIGAGVTASAVPGGTGLAALAIGAAGLRGRRRGRN